MRLVKIRHRGEVCAFTVRIYFLAAYVTETEKNRFPSESGFFYSIEITEFVRFEKGEGIEKREDDFAAEVAAMTK